MATFDDRRSMLQDVEAFSLACGLLVSDVKHAAGAAPRQESNIFDERRGVFGSWAFIKPSDEAPRMFHPLVAELFLLNANLVMRVCSPVRSQSHQLPTASPSLHPLHPPHLCPRPPLLRSSV